MTATSPAIDTIPSATLPRWRITWAERENDRRRRAHHAETEAWVRRNDQLIRLQIEAGTFLGYAQPRTGLPVDLDDDEVIYRVLPAAELVEAEARHGSGLPTPGLTVAITSIDAPGRTLPRGLRVVDAGMAVVTDRRVAFAGRESRREWAYADMVGPAHHPHTPITLLHSTDGSRLTGLLVPTAATVNFRFYLTLAFAAAAGQRAAVAAQIDALRDAHRRARPTPPPPAEPEHAPLTALRPDRRLATAAAVVALTFATVPVGAFGAERGGPPYRANAGAGVATTGAPHTIGAAAQKSLDESTTPDSSAPASPAGESPTPPTGAGSGVAGRVLRPRTPSRATSAAPTVTVTVRAARPTATAGPAPTTPAAPTTGPAPTTTPPRSTDPTTDPTTGPAPTTGSPSPEPVLINLCLDPLRLPLAERLLCP
ncbi:hypothetical protein U2F26_02875 [Micromonospora sp. 4G57]|uniref:Uncharacterized protein n=1 Tax=Micromonospora sicca TaxID=2202420 RepID=A0ABU5JCF5_9ACTN|nr:MULTISPECIES: hypothetical protein [unclassified Micromonospora]MDZ5441674.1 hypothetical protein [Micromonospora sp. 4G57]MDZ5490235.1 hypothetical protein [Micromonospora sp. 4G53]